MQKHLQGQIRKANVMSADLPTTSPLDAIRTGDPLCWEATSPFGHRICEFEGGHWCSHVGMAAWIQISGGRSQIWTFDMLYRAGGVATPLEAVVKRWPGKCHVFRPRAEYNYDGKAAAEYFAEHFLGEPYGTAAVLWQAASTRWWARWLGLFQPNRNDYALSKGPPYCSHAASAAAHFGGGVDVCHKLAPESTWPRDIANSNRLEVVVNALRLEAA